ncbi:MAG: 3-phosphoshikimate 1-carboxyvinyltransferase [Deltaproteobacteria bacterium HGW-Deltaproteobacteria-13]|nr:MAG: 3-phosphoshikimate 1-carboxyvinyltransferase [Deltaproteobacteria bacterium HGW-Deltaproteobacteria-13]
MNHDAHFKEVSAAVSVPGSKSLSQRALVAAALAQNNSLISNVLFSQDTHYLIEGLRLLGAKIYPSKEGFIVCGTSGKIANSGEELFLGNNGTALRFLTALTCLGKGKYVLTGEKRLCERPVGALAEALRKMGAGISCSNNCPPVEINADGLTGGKITLRDIESSQYVSALLLCAPYTLQGMDLTLQGGVVSTPYIDLTINVMRDFGAKISQTGKYEYHVAAGEIYQGREYHVEGDASSASYFFLAAALLKKTIRVAGINRQSKQGDIRLLDVLEELGCKIRSEENWIEVTGNNLVEGDLTFDLNDMPDMVPTLAVLSAFRRGQTIIDNVAHLRIKESNRLAAMVAELNRAGIEAREMGDGLVIQGGKMRPAKIETYNDHRMAMSFAIASLVVNGIEISNKKCVDKSFPAFWEEVRKI